MNLQALRRLAKAHGISVRHRSRAEMLNIIISHGITDWPQKLEGEPTLPAKVVDNEKAVVKDHPKQAIHVSGRVLVQNVGIFEIGYHILDRELALSLIGKSKRIRLASPGEVAEYYGVR